MRIGQIGIESKTAIPSTPILLRLMTTMEAIRPKSSGGIVT